MLMPTLVALAGVWIGWGDEAVVSLGGATTPIAVQ
jgi:hypothetical protein